jgi:phosphoribosylformylglycinamidine synthase
MNYVAEIDVMPLKALLDPQGKAVTNTMHNIGFKTVENVRIGKHITLNVEAENLTEAEKKVKEMCNKVLSNPIMEYFEFTVKENK